MKPTSLLSLALASLATSRPTESNFDASTHHTPFGKVFVTNDESNFAGNLVVTGDCFNFNINAVYAQYSSAYKCRFFK
jgi:hypothetical protein